MLSTSGSWLLREHCWASFQMYIWPSLWISCWGVVPLSGPGAPVGCPVHSIVHSSLTSHQCCGASRDWTVTIGQSLVWGLLSYLQDKVTSSCQNNTSYCVFQPALSALSFIPGPSDSQELRVQQLWINLGTRSTTTAHSSSSGWRRATQH